MTTLLPLDTDRWLSSSELRCPVVSATGRAIFHLKGLDHQIILNHMRDAHTVRNAWVRCYLMGLKYLGNSSENTVLQPNGAPVTSAIRARCIRVFPIGPPTTKAPSSSSRINGIGSEGMCSASGKKPTFTDSLPPWLLGRATQSLRIGGTFRSPHRTPRLDPLYHRSVGIGPNFHIKPVADWIAAACSKGSSNGRALLYRPVSQFVSKLCF